MPARAVTGPSALSIRARAVRWIDALSSLTSSAFTTSSDGRVHDIRPRTWCPQALRRRRRRPALEREPEEAPRGDEFRKRGARCGQRAGRESRCTGRGLARVRLVIREPQLDRAVDERNQDRENGEDR